MQLIWQAVSANLRPDIGNSIVSKMVDQQRNGISFSTQFYVLNRITERQG